jgi:hypothetical protein
LDLNGQAFTCGSTFTVQDGGNLRLQGDEALTAPTLDSGSTVTYDATSGTRDIKDYSYHHLTINGSGGTFTVPALSDTSLGGNLTVSAGTLDINDQTLSWAGNTLIDGGTLKTGTGSVTMGDAGGDTFTISSGQLDIESDDTDTDLSISPTTWTNSGGTVNYLGSSSTTVFNKPASYNHLIINSNSNTFTQDSALDINGNFTLTDGTLDTDGFAVTIAGNWTKSGGTFTHDNNTVTFDGTNQTITGSTTFFNFTKADSNDNSTDEVLTFDNTSTQTISGTWTLNGLDADDRINLVSDSPGDQWEVSPTSTRTIDFVDVTDSNNTSGTDILCTDNCIITAQNNTAWVDDSTNPSVSTLSPADGTSSVVTTDNLVITFSEAVDVETGNITLYKQLDDSVFEQITLPSALVTGTGTTTITIDPTSDLDPSTDYYIQIDSTAFDDAASNSFAGITDKTTWNFATSITLDESIFDITVQMKGSAQASPGDILEGVLSITNTKATNITSTDLVFDLPPGISFLGGSDIPSQNISIQSRTQQGNKYLLRVDSIPSGSTQTLTFKLQVGSNAPPGETLTFHVRTENL